MPNVRDDSTRVAGKPTETATALADLVRAYVQAHIRHNCRAVDDRRMIWAARPIRAEYNAVHQAVRSEADAERHSDTYVEEAVDELLQSALDDETSVDSAVQDLMTHLQHPVTTRVYVPLDGVTIDEPELHIGSVHLVRMDEEAFERLIILPLTGVMRRNPSYSDEAGARFVEMHRQRLCRFIGRACVLIQTDMDLRQTFDVLEDTVQEACDFLQLCLAVLSSRRPQNPVRWSTGVVNAWRLAFGMSDGPRWRTTSDAKMQIGGPSVRLNSSSVERVREAGLLAFSENLGRKPASEYERTLRRAVRWFARAERERHADDRKLGYVTAVDLFFSQPPDVRDRLSVTQRFCHGAAYAMTDEPAGAAVLARQFVYMYRSRSETSHEGAYDLADHEDIDQFRYAVLRILARLGAQNFTTKGDIADWMARRRAALSPQEIDAMDDATRRATIEQDDALASVIDLLRSQSAGDVFGGGREAHVLSKLLADAVRSREHLLHLRPFAERLLGAVQAARVRGEDAVPATLEALRALDWLEQGLRERVAAGLM